MGDEGHRATLATEHYDGESVPKRSRHVAGGDGEIHVGDEFKTALYKELLTSRETGRHWRGLCAKYLNQVPEVSLMLQDHSMVESPTDSSIDVRGVLDDLDRRLSEEIRKRNSLEIRLFELNKSIGEIPMVGEGQTKPTAEAAKSDHSNDSSELYALKQLANDQASLVLQLQSEKQDIVAMNTALSEKLRRVPEEIFEDPRPYKVLLEDFKALREDMHALQRNLKSLQDEYASRMSERRRLAEPAEEAQSYFQGKLKPLVDSLDSEVSRLRRERDNMRTLYEKTNSQLQSLSKENSNLRRLLSETEKHCKTLEGIAKRQEDHFKLAADSKQDMNDGSGVKSLSNEIGSLYVELESLATTFEEIKAQNVALIKSLSERDEVITRVQSEKLKAEFALTQTKKESDMHIQKASHLEKLSLERLEMAEKRSQSQQKAFEEAEMRLHYRLLNQEELSGKILSMSSELKALRSRVEFCHQLESQIADNSRLIEKLKSEKSTITIELKSCQERLARLLDRGTRGGQDPEELEMYRKLMKCNSCHLRDKNAVILKCMHCFCRQCLDTRIETRQRKCPNCGEAFGAGDVRTIYL